MILTNRVALYVPSTVNGNVPNRLACREWTRRLQNHFSRMFGGCTVVKGRGAWVSEENGLVQEVVHIVYAYCTPAALKANEKHIRALASSMASAMGQEVVSLEINNTLELIERKGKVKTA